MPPGWPVPPAKPSHPGALAANRRVGQRFAADATGSAIRASQGHSVEVDLGLHPVVPPEVLFHGTARRSLESILREGLRPMGRQHVHLSADVATAWTVGRRHGSPVVLEVDAGALHEAGSAFFRSANGVWLVDHVPPSHLRPAEPQG